MPGVPYVSTTLCAVKFQQPVSEYVRAEMRLIKGGVFFLTLLALLSPAQSTHLAAVYRNDILILRDADLILPDSSPSWESLSLTLPRPLSYPVALTQDSLNNRLFVAEASVHAEGKILSLTLSDQLEVVEMTPVIENGNMSVIEGMSYSPKSEFLYWTDATDKHIYKAMVPHELSDSVSKPEIIQDLGHRNNPRGLAVDPCNELLYWSEKGGGIVPGSVEMWNPDDNHHQVVRENEGKYHSYQGIFFNATTRSLLWASTKEDKVHTTCYFGKTSVDEMHHEDLVSVEDCYPFSLTIDKKFIYWADWAREGIMRASLTDPSDIVKLVHTPHTTKGAGEYFGVYGLVKLIQENPADENSCKDKHGKTQNYEHKLQQNPAENPHQGAEKEEKGTGDIKDVSDISFANPEYTKERQDSRDQKAEGSLESSGADRINDNEKDGEWVKNAGSSGDSEGIEMENSIVDTDRIVMSVKHMQMKPQADSSSRKPMEKAKPAEAVTGVYTDKTKTDSAASPATQDLPNSENFSRCHEGQMMIVAVLVLAAICALFLGSTIILAIILYRRKTVSCKGLSQVHLEGPQAVPVQPPRQVRRFGPKKSVASGKRSGLSGSATCSGLANDGVTINIEDCCQMTLCETPCYTTIKKQGKSYKDIRKNTLDDKKGLLDDSDDI